MMLRMISAEWLRIRRFWLTWVLLSFWILILGFQIRAKVNRLDELESRLVELPQLSEMTPLEQIQSQLDRHEVTEVREGLRYPDFIGYALRQSLGFGWFLVILFSAVMIGEDFSRRTLRTVLSHGIRRSSYLLMRCLALWFAVGLALLLIAILAAVVGMYIHGVVSGDSITLINLGQALIVLPRAWFSCLPFVAVSIFWAVLARHAGPALGVNIAIHAFERLTALFVPAVLIPLSSIQNSGAEIPAPLRLFEIQSRVLNISLGYNADVFVRWGSLFAAQIRDANLLPDSPWRAAGFLIFYTVVFLGWAIVILHRRDVTYAS